MTKKELRLKYKEKRQSLNANQIEEFSMQIANHLLQMNIWHWTFYHLFLSIEEQKEVNTDYILNILSGKDKHIIVSKSNFKDSSLSHFLLSDNTRLQKNSYGIPEPQNGIPIDVESIDVVFIPMLAYDLNGNRIGYGKGFYDRFLSGCRKEVLKIGLSFFEAEHETIIASQNDIPLDFAVYPEGIIKF